MLSSNVYCIVFTYMISGRPHVCIEHVCAPVYNNIMYVVPWTVSYNARTYDIDICIVYYKPLSSSGL